MSCTEQPFGYISAALPALVRRCAANMIGAGDCNDFRRQQGFMFSSNEDKSSCLRRIMLLQTMSPTVRNQSTTSRMYNFQNQTKQSRMVTLLRPSDWDMEPFLPWWSCMEWLMVISPLGIPHKGYINQWLTNGINNGYVNQWGLTPFWVIPCNSMILTPMLTPYVPMLTLCSPILPHPHRSTPLLHETTTLQLQEAGLLIGILAVKMDISWGVPGPRYPSFNKKPENLRLTWRPK